jgi:hypothetical protein
VVDGVTGRQLRVDGEVMAVYTRRPEPAMAELMRNRDPLRWVCVAECLSRGAS